jgi:hypothetical protein
MPNCSDRWGFASNPNYFFVLTQKKVIKKSQGCLRIARKTSARRLKSFKLACGSNRKDFITPTSLVFRPSGRGQSVREGKLLILGKVTDTHIK